MVEIKMQVPDNLAQRLQPMYNWLPTVLELGLVGFKTQAVRTASEIVEFLAGGPSPVHPSQTVDNSVPPILT